MKNFHTSLLMVIDCIVSHTHTHTAGKILT